MTSGVPSAPNPTAAILIIGNEILSGRTRDANTYHLAGELSRIGIDLQEVRIIADEQSAIVAAINQLRSVYTYVFTSGGIGPTHDDITADAVAVAFDVPIGVREEVRALLARHFAARGLDLTPARLRMARIPDGADLIDNPVSAAPGFSIGNVHVMAGVPSIFQAMVAGLLPRLASGVPLVAREYRFDVGEGLIAGPLAALAADFPDLSIGSYPFNHDGAHGTNIVIRGTDAARVDAALARLAAVMPRPAEVPDIKLLATAPVLTKLESGTLNIEIGNEEI